MHKKFIQISALYYQNNWTPIQQIGQLRPIQTDGWISEGIQYTWETKYNIQCFFFLLLVKKTHIKREDKSIDEKKIKSTYENKEN